MVVVVWPVYCLHWEGSSMERRKMDLPDWEGGGVSSSREKGRGKGERSSRHRRCARPWDRTRVASAGPASWRGWRRGSAGSRWTWLGVDVAGEEEGEKKMSRLVMSKKNNFKERVEQVGSLPDSCWTSCLAWSFKSPLTGPSAMWGSGVVGSNSDETTATSPCG